MKKFCFILFCIASVAGTAFAQELRLHGYMSSGFGIYMPDDGDATISLLSATTAAGNPARFRLHGSYTNAYGTAGIRFRLQAIAPFDTGAGAYLDNARVWLKILQNKVTFIAGKLDDPGVLITNGGIATHLYIADGLGMFTQAEPVPNLTLGVGILTSATGEKNTVNVMERANYRFGARYLFPDLINLVVLFADNGKSAAYDEHRLHFAGGVDVLALKELGLSALNFDVEFNDMQDDTYKNMLIGQRITYGFNNLEMGFRARQSFILGSYADTLGYSPDLFFKLYGSYKLIGGSIIPRLEMGYGLGTGGALHMRSDVWYAGHTDWKDGDNKGMVNPTAAAASRVIGYNQDAASLSIIPQVQFRISKSADWTITLGGGALMDLTVDNEKTDGMFFVDFRVAW